MERSPGRRNILVGTSIDRFGVANEARWVTEEELQDLKAGGQIVWQERPKDYRNTRPCNFSEGVTSHTKA